MIEDLAVLPEGRLLRADICIVGGGIAGLIAADRLRRYGLSVVVLESGSQQASDADDELNRVVMLERSYAGATIGRSRGLGGTSQKWGGALIPFLPEDMGPRPHIDLEGWPLGLSDLQFYIGEIEALFGVARSPADSAYLAAIGPDSALPSGDSEFLMRFAKWPPFSKRNVASLLRKRLSHDKGLRIYTGATVTAVVADREAGRIGHIAIVNRGNVAYRLFATHFVLCAGAIETTRLLLLLQRAGAGEIFGACSVLGRFFHDHISMIGADIEVNDADALNRLAGFRFSKGAMRSQRFELSPTAQVKTKTPSGFVHISAQSADPSSFDAIRDLLRTFQRNRSIDLRNAVRATADVPFLLSAAHWRIVHRQLRWPSHARHHLHVVAEQTPRASNRIALSNETDQFGVPRASLNWSIDAGDMSAVQAIALRFDAFWKRHGLNRLGNLHWRLKMDGAGQEPPATLGDIFHPGGTTRMGRDQTDAVVNRDLSVFGISNLHVASTSVFPSGASANPTLMLMALTLRLADRLGPRVAGASL